MTNKLLKEIQFEDCRALIYDDGAIMLSDYDAEHQCYLEKEEVDQLIEVLKILRLLRNKE